MKRKLGLAALLSAFLLSFALNSAAQTTTTVVTTGLDLPMKIIPARNNTFLVAEGGTPEPNTGRISVVDAETGVRHTLISGLPSGVNNLGGELLSDGTTGIYLDRRVLYVTSGIGDAATNIGGLEYPTQTPSSPLFDSVMMVVLPSRYESLDSEFAMTLDDQNALASGQWIQITNGQGHSIRVKVIADLPNYRPEPQPGHPDAVRSSHLFGVERVGWELFVNDASFNLVYKINLFTGQSREYPFPDRPNPLFPTIGGPFIEAVPNNIHQVGGRILVSELTGFPFVPGQSDVKSLNPFTGELETIISGLSSAMDFHAVKTRRHGTSYYVLEFSADLLGGDPGRMRLFDDAGNASVVVPVLITPSSMAFDDSGDIFVTNIFPGTITRVHLSAPVSPEL